MVMTVAFSSCQQVEPIFGRRRFRIIVCEIFGVSKRFKKRGGEAS